MKNNYFISNEHKSLMMLYSRIIKRQMKYIIAFAVILAMVTIPLEIITLGATDNGIDTATKLTSIVFIIITTIGVMIISLLQLMTTQDVVNNSTMIKKISLANISPIKYMLSIASLYLAISIIWFYSTFFIQASIYLIAGSEFDVSFIRLITYPIIYSLVIIFVSQSISLLKIESTMKSIVAILLVLILYIFNSIPFLVENGEIFDNPISQSTINAYTWISVFNPLSVLYMVSLIFTNTIFTTTQELIFVTFTILLMATLCFNVFVGYKKLWAN